MKPTLLVLKFDKYKKKLKNSILWEWFIIFKIYCYFWKTKKKLMEIKLLGSCSVKLLQANTRGV